jgi:hypothetical protein
MSYLRNRKKKDLTIKDCYKHYCTRVIEELRLSYPEFRKVVESFHIKVMEEIFEDKEVHLPFQILFRVRKQERKVDDFGDLPVNYKATKALWKEKPELIKKTFIRYDQRFVYKILWDRKECRLKNKTHFSFYATRKNNRTLAQLILSGTKQFTEKL